MDESFEFVGVVPRDVTRLVVGRIGRVQRCEDPPGVQVLDAAGVPVGAVDGFLRWLAASDATSATLYSYASALLRWWRFLPALGVDWDRVSRVEVRDFVLWLRATPTRLGGAGYAPATINHNLAVLRSFYDERMTAGVGPVVNPVPAATGRDGQRPYAHHNPMERFGTHRRGPLRQKSPVAGARGLGDRAFDELFASMGCDRDRALLAAAASSQGVGPQSKRRAASATRSVGRHLHLPTAGRLPETH